MPGVELRAASAQTDKQVETPLSCEATKDSEALSGEILRSYESVPSRDREGRTVGSFGDSFYGTPLATELAVVYYTGKHSGYILQADYAEGRLAAVEGDFRKAETNLRKALTRAGDCETAYREACGPLRRQFNLAFFRHLHIDDDYNVSVELTEPFDSLLGPELRRAVAVRAGEALNDAVARELRHRTDDGTSMENEEHPREPAEPLPVGAASTTAFSYGGGFSTEHMVPRAGLEPAPPD